MIMVDSWAGHIHSDGERTPVTAHDASFTCHTYYITGLKSLNNFRHWTLSWASSNQLAYSQTIFSRIVSAFTARIWMRLPLVYPTNCIILAV